MGLFIVFGDYIHWHYSRAFSDIFHIWRNVTYFVFNFFSIPLLLRTLFSPWKRIEATRETQGLDIGDFISTKIVNTIMRLIGALMRGSLIVVGLFFVGLSVVFGLLFFVLWTLLPFVVVVFTGAGLKLIVFG